MKSLTAFHKYRSAGLMLLRLVIAVIFIYHGGNKLMMWDTMPALMKFLAIVEPLGGIALLVGYLTELAALGLAIIMGGAIWMKIFSMKIGFAEMQGTGWEFDLIILAGCVALMVVGPGSYSIDARCRTDK